MFKIVTLSLRRAVFSWPWNSGQRSLEVIESGATEQKINEIKKLKRWPKLENNDLTGPIACMDYSIDTLFVFNTRVKYNLAQETYVPAMDP